MPSTLRNLVETLFFFNERQSSFAEQIKATVEESGSPTIIESEDRLWLALPSASAQCLFACDRSGQPFGVALYGRPAAELLRIYHLAVNAEETGSDQPGIAALLVNRIREIARSIRGVTRIQLPYRRAFLRV